MEKKSFYQEENEFYQDVESDFTNLIERIFFNLLMDGYAWEAINGDVYHLYYEDFNLTGVFFSEKDFEDEVKEALWKVAEKHGYVITNSNYSGIDITIPLIVKGELKSAQKKFITHMKKIKEIEEILLKKASEFVNAINKSIKSDQFMNTAMKHNGLKLYLNADLSNAPGFFLDAIIKFLHEYWLKEEEAKECTIKIGEDEQGENWLLIEVKR